MIAAACNAAGGEPHNGSSSSTGQTGVEPSTTAASSEGDESTTTGCTELAGAVPVCATHQSISVCFDRRFESNIGSANGVRVGDFDGNGIHDIVITEFEPAGIRQFLGGSGCSFEAKIVVDLQGLVEPKHAVAATAVADVTNDGVDDLIFTLGLPFRVVIVDGIKDVGLSSTVKFIPAKGSGSSAFVQNGLAVADVDGDGLLDIIYLVSGTPNHIAVHWGDGSGGFSDADVTQDLPFDGVEADDGFVIRYFDVFDFNEDGRADVNIAYFVDDFSYPFNFGARVLLGNGDGRFISYVPYDVAEYNHANVEVAGDFNGDGHMDFAVWDWLYLGAGDGTFLSQIPLALGDVQPPIVGDLNVVGDLNGDGRDDIHVWDRIFVGTATGLSPALVGAPQYYRAEIADMDGDGLGDLVAPGNGTLVVHYGAAGVGEE